MLLLSPTIFYIASMFGARLLTAAVMKKTDNLTSKGIENKVIESTTYKEVEDNQQVEDVWKVLKKHEAFNMLIKGILQKNEESVSLISEALIKICPYYKIKDGYIHFKEDIANYISSDKFASMQHIVKIGNLEKKEIEKKLNTKPMENYFEYQCRSLEYASLLQYYIDDEYDVANINKTKDEIRDSLDECFRDILCAKNNKVELLENSEPINKNMPPIFNYQMLLGKAGRVYNSYMDIYKSIGLIDTKNRYSHEIVYEIATAILKKTDFYFTRNLTVSRFAQDITDSNINYFHNNVGKKEGKSNAIMKDLFSQYLDGRPIKSYYYFLKMCTNIYDSAIKSQLGNNIETEKSLIDKKLAIDLKDLDENIKMISYNLDVLDLIVEGLKYRKYHFLYNLTNEQIKGDILVAYINRQKQ